MDSAQGNVNIELSVRIGSDPIAGELRVQETPAQPFVGWVALVRAVEDAIKTAPAGGTR